MSKNAVQSGGLVVTQRGKELPPLTSEQLVWLNQRGYLHDQDTVRSADGRSLGDVYEVVTRAILSGVPLESAERAVVCQTCGTPFTVQEIDTPAWCPDCGEELSVQELRRQAAKRPRRGLVLGGRRLTTMDGHEWQRLLVERPDFAFLANWERLRGEDWMRLLLAHPELREHCRWERLSPDQWELLAERGVVDPSWAQFARKPTAEQVALLHDHPEMAPFVAYSRLTLEHWKTLFHSAPEIAIEHRQWLPLCTPAVTVRLYLDDTLPDAIKRLLPARELSGRQWLDLLVESPALADFCPWETVLQAIRSLPAPTYARNPLGRDKAMLLNEDQHDCHKRFPELWEKRQELWEQSKGTLKGLPQRDLWLLGDFFGWEPWIDLKGLSRKELCDLLARHPGYGDAQRLWRTLTPQEISTLLLDSPSLAPRVTLPVKQLTHEHWERLFQIHCDNPEFLQQLGQLYPLPWMETLTLQDREIPALRRRIVIRWIFLAGASIVLLVLLMAML